MLHLTIHTINGRRVVLCDSLSQCSEKWIAARNEECIGGSGMRGQCGIVRKGKRKVARISYNGRVWPADEWTIEQEPLSDSEIAAIDQPDVLDRRTAKLWWNWLIDHKLDFHMDDDPRECGLPDHLIGDIYKNWVRCWNAYESSDDLWDDFYAICVERGVCSGLLEE